MKKFKKSKIIIIKCIFIFLLSNQFLSHSIAKDINIQEDITLSFVCVLEKKIIKNSEYNYKTFLAKEIDDKDLEKFEIKAKKPKTLNIIGLSLFLSNSDKLNVKVVNKGVVLFKSIDKKNNYSESGILTRKSGELIHEITRNIKSENSEKDILFYYCKKREGNA